MHKGLVLLTTYLQTFRPSCATSGTDNVARSLMAYAAAKTPPGEPWSYSMYNWTQRRLHGRPGGPTRARAFR